MKVFVSWSGERSRVIATKLRAWLPEVIQSVDPFMPDSDVGAGARWGEELDSQLAASQFGIVCVTPENLGSRWLNFEAGALAKSVPSARVVPYLIGMSDRSEFVNSPLTRFQAKLALTETLAVIQELNAAMSQPLDVNRLANSYARLWPELQVALRDAQPPKNQTPKPGSDAVLREILETVRDLARNKGTEAISISSKFPDAVERRRAGRVFGTMMELLTQADVSVIDTGFADNKYEAIVQFADRRAQVIVAKEEFPDGARSLDIARELAARAIHALRVRSAFGPSLRDTLEGAEIGESVDAPIIEAGGTHRAPREN